MKKVYILFVLLVFLLAHLCGCNYKETTDVQYMYDWGETAKEYAEKLFDSHMIDQQLPEYTIEKSFCGYNVSNSADSTYTVVFLYNCGGKTETYGFLILVDKYGNCSLVEEGTEIADLLF